jgi:hypothetical protein
MSWQNLQKVQDGIRGKKKRRRRKLTLQLGKQEWEGRDRWYRTCSDLSQCYKSQLDCFTQYKYVYNKLLFYIPIIFYIKSQYTSVSWMMLSAKQENMLCVCGGVEIVLPTTHKTAPFTKNQVHFHVLYINPKLVSPHLFRNYVLILCSKSHIEP